VRSGPSDGWSEGYPSDELCGLEVFNPIPSHASSDDREETMAGKARIRPSFKKHTRRYREVIAPAKTLEGQKNLAKKRRYANRHG
jgi:hypothetical protein